MYKRFFIITLLLLNVWLMYPISSIAEEGRITFDEIGIALFTLKPKEKRDFQIILSSGEKSSGPIAGTNHEVKLTVAKGESFSGAYLHAVLTGFISSYRVSVNGIQLLVSSDGNSIDKKISLPSGLLNVGKNTLTLENLDNTSDEMGVLNDSYFIIPGAVFGSLDENSPPAPPQNISPANRSNNVSITPTLQASAFSDKDTGDIHQSSQWQITTKAGDYTNPVYDSGVDSENLTSIIVPKGKLDYATVYYWRVRYQDSKGAWSNYSEETRFTTKLTGNDVYTATLALKKGINIISLPLDPDASYTASTLAVALNATIVIQAKDGLFDAYVRAGSVGTDFPIQMGQGYIVNLIEAKNFNITGKPWGEPVPVAPSMSTPAEPWAFVIAGHVEGEVPEGGKLRATNLRTKESIVVPIFQSGQFTAAFVDMSRKSVVAAGDEIITQIISRGNTPLTEAKRHIISREQIANAYSLTYLSAKPEQTRLLQNYPNPFNPETWIPYQLAKHADVTIHIYNTHGQLIRTLWLGQQNVGFYVDGSKAAYWNGRSESGERVASGLYFYQLKAGDFTAIRRMVIVK